MIGQQLGFPEFAEITELRDLVEAVRVRGQWGLGLGSPLVTRTWLLLAAVSMTTSPSPTEALALVVAAWDIKVAIGEMAASSARKYEMHATRLVNDAILRGATDVEGVADAVPLWIVSKIRTRTGDAAPCCDATRKLRLSVSRSMFAELRSLGLTDRFPAVDISIVATSPGDFRPLVDAEMHICRVVSDQGGYVRSAAAVALSCSGCAPGEVGRVRVADVDLQGGLIHAPGTGQVRSRQLPLPGAWERRVLADRINHLRGLSGLESADWPEHTYVAGSPTGARPASGSAISMTLGDVLRDARLANQMGVRPGSIQGWAAARVWSHTSDVVEVARLLGVSQLDTAARVVGLAWIPAPGDVVGLLEGLDDDPMSSSAPDIQADNRLRGTATSWTPALGHGQECQP